MLISSSESRYGGATGEETELRVREKVTGEKMIQHQQDFKDVLLKKFRYEVEERDGTEVRGSYDLMLVRPQTRVA